MRLCALLLLLAAGPGSAGRYLAAGQGGRDLASVAGGEVLVFAEPGSLLRRREFGEGILGVSAAPNAPLVAVLTRTPAATALTLWDYAVDEVRAAPDDVVSDALAVAFADGGHVLFVLDGKSAVQVLGLDDLRPRRAVPTAAVADDPAGLHLAASPRDWFLAFASRTAVQLGKSDAESLEAVPVAAGTAQGPAVSFDPTGQSLIVGGDAGLYVVPTRDGPVRMLPLLGATPSAAFDVGGDGQFVYLADGAKLHAVRLSTGLIHLTGTVREGAVRPVAVQVLRPWGAVAILYDDGVICWYRPLARELTAQYPPRAGGLPQLPALPDGEAAARCAEMERLLTEIQAFETAEPLVVAVLDGEFNRLEPLESAAKEAGWPALITSTVAAAAGQAGRIAPAFAGLAPRLMEVDRIELPGVTFVPEVTPAAMERRLGPREATAVQRQLADGRSYPVYRIGPFLLPVDGEQFPPGCSLSLTAQSIARYLRAPGPEISPPER